MLRKLPLLLLFPFIISCGDRGYTLIKVLTDQKDMVLISEYYNRVQDESRLLLTYDDYISYDDILEIKPDLVIARDMNNPLFTDSFLPVTPPEGIYPVLLGDRDGEGRISLVPLAFDLPVILYSREERDLPFMMDGETLMREGSARNRETESRFSHMGFSPLWNPEFLYWYLSALRIGFYGDGAFVYDQDRVSAGINRIREWVETSNRSLDWEKEFSRKYRYIPDYKLLQKRIIDFVPMTYGEYSALPGKETAGMTFSWFGDGEKMTPLDGVYGGIPGESDHPEKAEEFLAWLLSDREQADLIRYKGVASPGFALFDKFSSREAINRLSLPELFPDKLGNRMFLSEQLGELPREPENWSAIRAQVLTPWLRETLWDNGVLPLSSYYREWQLQFID